MTHAEYLASESTAEIKLVSDDDDWILGRITAVQQGLSRMGSGQE